MGKEENALEMIKDKCKDFTPDQAVDAFRTMVNSSTELARISGENTGKALDFLKEQSITKREIAKYESQERVMIENIQQKYALMRGVFSEIFAERRMAINKDFEVIDKGLRENNYALIAKGLDSLSQVVIASPFADIVKFHEMLESDEKIEF